ncbi:hypothetical protein [Dyadobacter frigoris]|uniref:Uncharacterized protein n=1 Tax=Dyadobacter frigoris TaxID=2576211 RepID=A0A4U6D7Z6_9BACT|nr:hypothetical protein [Dyadobacter frigoris]TKT92258.1 hypothetical protein FDK13_09765 [Dyadobacter frigoris]GLU53438.1 hypothetical protein Dfri01_28990 [Dyadobacter frigoris]
MGKWTNWPLIFPETDEQPGIGGPLPMWTLIEKGLALSIEMLLGSPYSRKTGSFAARILSRFFSKYLNGVRQKDQENKGCMYFLLKPFLGEGGIIERMVKKEMAHITEALKMLK